MSGGWKRVKVAGKCAVCGEDVYRVGEAYAHLEYLKASQSRWRGEPRPSYNHEARLTGRGEDGEL